MSNKKELNKGGDVKHMSESIIATKDALELARDNYKEYSAYV